LGTQEIHNSSKGLAIAEAFFEEFGLPTLHQHFPELINRISAGLLGEGSEMLGYDDELSRDHDWEPRFLLFLEESDHQKLGKAVAAKFNDLRPASFHGINLSMTKAITVQSIDGFYKELTGLPCPPKSIQEWITVRENDLCYAQAGKIFYDPTGNLTRRYRAFQKIYYPREVWLGRIAAQLFRIWHYGKYNICDRMLKRDERIGALIGMGLVIQAAMRLTFLLNHRFSPYWKWLHCAFVQLPYLAPELNPILQKIEKASTLEDRVQVIGQICDLVRISLHEQEIFPDRNKRDHMGFLEILNNLIQDKQVRAVIFAALKCEGHF
jgi:hypothetical protein